MTGILSLAIKGLDDGTIRSLLWDAGRGSWLKSESMTPEHNEARIAELIQKHGGIEAFRPASSDSRPN